MDTKDRENILTLFKRKEPPRKKELSSWNPRGLGVGLWGVRLLTSPSTTMDFQPRQAEAAVASSRLSALRHGADHSPRRKSPGRAESKRRARGCDQGCVVGLRRLQSCTLGPW